MNFELSKDQHMIKSAAREFLEKECPKETVREIEESESGYSDGVWQKMTDLGWLGMSIPEEYGGLASPSPDFLELMVLLEEMGASLMPGPFFSTIVLGACSILDAGSELQKKSFLPAIAEGRLRVALALIEPSGTYMPSGIEAKAVTGPDGYRLSGKKLLVENGNVADYLICAARITAGASGEDGITLFLVNAKSPGIAINTIPTMGLEKQCEVTFEEVLVSEKDILGRLNEGWPIVTRMLEKAAIARSAEMLGAMEACLGITKAYAIRRVQYGRSIASFQAIQHYFANIWMQIVISRDLVYKAALLINDKIPCAAAASMAKAWTGKALLYTSERCVQIHGAIGVTRECDVGLYYRQAKAWDLSFGNADHQLSFIGEVLEKEAQI